MHRNKSSASLLKWLAAIDGPKDYGSDELNEQRISNLGKLIFPQDSFISYSDLLSKIASHIGREITKSLLSSYFTALEGLLICAVSEDCEERALYVNHILSLDHKDQVEIMNLIRCNMSEYVNDAQCESSTSNNNDTETDLGNKATSLDTSPIINDSTYYTSNDDVCGVESRMPSSSSFCKTCEVNNKGIEKMKVDISVMHEEIRQLELAHGQDLQRQSQHNINLELEILEKDGYRSQLEESLRAATIRARSLENDINENQKLIGSFQKISDEVEIIRPVAERGPQLEEVAKSLQSKLLELSDVKSRLLSESERNSLAYSKLLEIEEEVGVLRNYKLQLDSYQKRFDELHSSSLEMKSRLQSQNSEIEYLKSEKVRLLAGQSSSKEVNNQLLLELSAKQDKLRELNDGLVDNDDKVSETNPELMKDLKFLRHQNAELATLVSDTSLENLEKMEIILTGHINDNAALQHRLMSLKDEVSKAQYRISCLEELHVSILKEFRSFQDEAVEYSSMAVEELVTRKRNYKEMQNFQERKYDAVSFLMNLSKSALVENFNSVICDNNSTIDEKLRCITSVKDEISNLTSQISEINQQYLELADRNRDNLVDYELKCETAELDGLNLINDLKSSHQSCLSQMEASHFTTLSVERERCQALESTLEDERAKKRKLEREKRVAESETQRHRANLQTSLSSASSSSSTGPMATANSAEMDSMIKELRELQDELDNLKSEHSSLKARASFQQEKSSNGDGTREKPLSSINRSKRFVYGHDSKGLISKPQRGASVSQYLEDMTSDAPAVCNSIVGGSLSGQCSIGTENSENSAENNSNVNLGYIAVSELDIVDKRIDQLLKEKRELFAKCLEERKTKAELTQKLLSYENDITAFKGKITKIALEKERLERKMSKYDEMQYQQRTFNKENSANQWDQ